MAKRTGRLMPSFKQGDVIRVPLPYTDRSTRQHRPALVVSKGGIGEENGLLWANRWVAASRAKPQQNKRTQPSG